MKLQHLISELKRRNVFKVATIYGVTAWLLIQIAATVFPQFAMPQWTVRAVILLSAIGFPIALVLAWAYEVVPEKQVVEAKAEDIPIENQAAKRRIPSWIPIAIMLGLLGFTIWVFRKPIANATFVDGKEIVGKSIAILPFADLSEKQDQSYFSDGMMVEILDHLFKIQELRATPRSSTLSYRNTQKPLSQIAQELDVAHLLEGSVRKAGDQVRISVTLIDGKSGQIQWQHTYEEKLADVFGVQSDVAQQIARALQAEITPEVKQRIDAIPTKNLEAYDLYLRGRAQQGLFWTTGDSKYFEQAIQLYEQAIALDPLFSNAYVSIGSCYNFLAFFSPNYTPDFMRKSKDYINKAIDLNPDNSNAYVQLAYVQMDLEWDKAAALKSLQKAVRLSPNDADVYNALQVYYIRMGDCTKAAETFRTIKRLDKQGNRDNGWLLICKNDSIGLANMDLSKFDDLNAIQFYLHRGEFGKSIEIYERNINLLENTFIISVVGEAYALLGNKQEAANYIKKLVALREKRYVANCLIANIYMAMGEEETAYQLLEKAIKDRELLLHYMLTIGSKTFLKKRNEPRFKKLVDRTWIPLKENE